MAKKVDPLLIGARLREQFIENYSDPYFWSISLKPLPIDSYLDYQAVSTIFYLYYIWRRYKDPDTSEYQREQDARIIKRLDRAGGERQPGAPTGEKSLFIILISPLVKEKDYYSEYKQLRRTKDYEVAKKEILGRIVREFAGKRILFFSVDPGFEKKLERLNWRSLTPTKFNNYIIAYLVGYSHPDSAKVIKSRRRQRYKSRKD